MENIFKIDSIDDYNKTMGIETKHPLVTVVDEKSISSYPSAATRLTGTAYMRCS